MTQYVICALQMEGFHCWPEADGELAYLKNSHRHIFFYLRQSFQFAMQTVK